jgi:hypothetical protein
MKYVFRSKNGKPLNDAKKYQINGKEGQSQLTIQVTDADYGTYVCTASNPSGKFQAQFQIANAREYFYCVEFVFFITLIKQITHFCEQLVFLFKLSEQLLHS